MANRHVALCASSDKCAFARTRHAHDKEESIVRPRFGESHKGGETLGLINQGLGIEADFGIHRDCD